MKIAIVGTGRVGGALASAWSSHGHTLFLGARDPASAPVTALAATIGATVTTPGEAARLADVIVLAVPWAAVEAAAASLGDVSGKAVIDCTNPIAMGPSGMALERGHTTSGGEAVQALLAGAHVVKTLNQVGAEIMAHAFDLPTRPAMFMAGDDAGAKDVVGRLLDDIGFEPFDAGALERARLLEPYALVWINQALARGLGRDWAFAAVRRSKET